MNRGFKQLLKAADRAALAGKHRYWLRDGDGTLSEGAIEYIVKQLEKGR